MLLRLHFHSERQCPQAASDGQATPGRSGSADPVDDLFEGSTISKSDFLTPDVAAKVSVVSLLREVASTYHTFREERRFYERASTYKWKRSQIAQALKDVDEQLADVLARMEAISKLEIPVSALLTAAGSQTINLKMKLLTELSAKLAVLKTAISSCLKRLQVRNSQMRSRGSVRRTDDIVLRCYNPPELEWEEALTTLKEADEFCGEVGAPWMWNSCFIVRRNCRGRIACVWSSCLMTLTWKKMIKKRK